MLPLVLTVTLQCVEEDLVLVRDETKPVIAYLVAINVESGLRRLEMLLWWILYLYLQLEIVI
jgi:hypothetical protein